MNALRAISDTAVAMRVPLGLNTARSFVFKGGRVSEAQLARVEALGRRRGEGVKMVVTHHPFGALERLARSGVDVLMAGHAHAASVAGTSALLVQAGTATSSRTREEVNSFNLLRVSRRRVEVQQYALSGGTFAGAVAEVFELGDQRWRRCGPA